MAHTTFSQVTTGTIAPKSHTYAENGTYTVAVKVTDSQSAAGTKTFKVTVANVAPHITNFSGTDYLAGVLAFVNGGSAQSTLTTNYDDPGTKDTWNANFSYQDGAPLTSSVSPFVSGQKVTHPFASAGCKSASVKVTDDDGGSDTASTTIRVGSASFQSPLTNQRSTDKLKNGQVLPVKLHVDDCSGAPAANLNPSISLLKGDLTPASDDATDTITPPSVSSADSTGVMRSAGSGDYIYNMRVNLPTLNSDYTIVVKPYAPGSTGPELGKVIQATK